MEFNKNNQNNTSNARAEYNAAMNRLAKETENYRREHEHRNGKFMTVKDIDSGESMRRVDNKPYYKNEDGTPKGTIVVCEDCGAVFDTELFKPDKLEEILFIQESVLHQMKMLFKFDADEYEIITNDCFNAIETLRAANRFYNNAVRDLKDNNSRKNNGGGSRNTSKGGIGINRSMFNTKNF